MTTAIILAAGKSTRFGKNKLFMPILGFPLIYHTLHKIHDHSNIDEVFLVVAKKDYGNIENLIKNLHFRKVKKIIIGGKTRKQSFENAFKQIPKSKIVLVHNAANPLVTDEEITATILSAKKFGAAAVGKKIHDTVKEIKNGNFHKTHEHEKIIAMQTPQAAKYEIFKNALTKAKNRDFTDESSLLEYSGVKVKFIPASLTNFKITTPHDYEHLKHLMGDTPKNFLIGLGQDSHEFVQTKKGLYFGGILIKNELKLKADSDGDVILHALCNGILQALGEKSLGYFATPMFEKGIKDSKKYLDEVLKKMNSKKYKLNNIGLMLECKKPKIDELSYKLKKSLCELTGLESAKIGITATTGDNLTSFAKGKGIQCFAIVSLKK